MDRPWFVVVEREGIDGCPMLPYVLGPFPTEAAAHDEADSPMTSDATRHLANAREATT